jgi:hypothetical protein
MAERADVVIVPVCSSTFSRFVFARPLHLKPNRLKPELRTLSGSARERDGIFEAAIVGASSCGKSFAERE